MKKKSLILGVLLAGVLVTGYSVSGTYAKYVSTKATSDNARVAKWGYNAPISIDLFAESYKAKKADGTYETTATDVASNGSDNVVAPGTSGIYAFTLGAGANVPEVNYTIKIENITTDTTIDGVNYVATKDEIGQIEYYLMPVNAGQVTNGTTTFEEIFTDTAIADTSKCVKATDINDLVTQLDKKYMLADGTARKVTAANGTDDTIYAIGWRWVFGDNDASIVSDTNLGNQKDKTGTAMDHMAKVVLSVKVTAEQTELAAN